MEQLNRHELNSRMQCGKILAEPFAGAVVTQLVKCLEVRSLKVVQQKGQEFDSLLRYRRLVVFS